MSMDLEQTERAASAIAKQHSDAIALSEDTARELARADADYHRHLAIQTIMSKQEYGATISETIAKGSTEVGTAKEARDIAAGKDRAAMEKIRLARDDRAALLKIADWSRANEQF